MLVFFFFFQAEDGIRDLLVTGVQTCALPISWRFSISTWPRKHSFASWPAAFLYNRASGSVVEAWVALVRRSPRKSTLGLPGSSVGGGGTGSAFFLKLFWPAQASISVPSTVKCSSERRRRSEEHTSELQS